MDLGDSTPVFDLRLRAQWRGKGVGGQALHWLTAYLFTEFPAIQRAPLTRHLPGLVGEQGEAVTDVLGLNEAHRLDLAHLAEEAPAGSDHERVDEKPAGEVGALGAPSRRLLIGGRARCPPYWRPCTVSGFSRRRRASSQVIGTPVAVQVTKLEPAIRGRKCFMRCRCGSWPTAADIAA
jgi:hypothetical protein